MKVEIPTSMCDKLAEVAEKVSTIREFLEWLSARGVVLATFETTPNGWERLTVVASSDLPFRFFEIDEAELDAERRALLDATRRAAGIETEKPEDFQA